MRAALEAGDLLKYSTLIQRLHGLVRDVAASRSRRAWSTGCRPSSCATSSSSRCGPAARRSACASSPPSSTRSPTATPTGPRPPPSRTSAASSPRCPTASPRRTRMRNVVVTDPPRADAGDAETARRVRRRHRARGARAGSATSDRSSGRPGPGARIGGTAVTVLCWPGDNLMIHVAVEQCRPGDVLVVATNSPSTDGLFGELFATAAGPSRACAGWCSAAVCATSPSCGRWASRPGRAR